MASDWSIAVDRSVALSVEQVYRAWVEPGLMKRWMAPGTMRVPELTIDAVEGGLWQLVMVDVDGSQQKAFGRYTSLSRPDAVGLTWEWEGVHYETAISVTLVVGQAAGKTDVCIEQKGFPSMDAAQSHEAGWNSCLDKLEQLVVDAI